MSPSENNLPNDQEFQKKYLEYNYIDQRVKQLEEQSQIIDQQLAEINATAESLDELQSLKKDSEILIPISKGIFTKGTIVKSEKLLANVGSDVIVDKSVLETKNMMEKQKKNILEIKQKIEISLKKLVARASLLEKELNERALAQ